jgi:hypothetical protein
MRQTTLVLWAAHSILHSEFRLQATTPWSFVGRLGDGQNQDSCHLTDVTSRTTTYERSYL